MAQKYSFFNKNYLLYLFLILNSCNKNISTSNSAAADVANTDIRKVVETTGAALTSLFSQSDASAPQNEFLKRFNNKWNEDMIKKANQVVSQNNVKFKEIYGGYITNRFRLIDKQGIVHAWSEPSISPYLELALYSDVYFQNDSKLDGDPTKTVRNIIVRQAGRGGPEQPSELFTRNFLNALNSQNGSDWHFYALDEWHGKYPVQASDLPRSWDGWGHVGTIPELKPYRKPILKNVYVEYQNVEIAKGLHAGQTVNFKVILDCNKVNSQARPCYNWSEDSPSNVRVAPASLRVRQIRDRKIEIPEKNLSFNAKEALGFLDSSITGRDQNCVVGRTVFDEQGHIFGVVTAYYPGKEMGFDDLKEVDNIVITTVEDERVAFLLNNWYRTGSVKEISQNPINKFKMVWGDVSTTPWAATNLENQFDPDFVKELKSDQDLNRYAVARTKVKACHSIQDLELACKNEVDTLRHIRDSLGAKTRPAPPPRQMPNIACRYFSRATYVKPHCPGVRRVP